MEVEPYSTNHIRKRYAILVNKFELFADGTWLNLHVSYHDGGNGQVNDRRLLIGGYYYLIR